MNLQDGGAHFLIRWLVVVLVCVFIAFLLMYYLVAQAINGVEKNSDQIKQNQYNACLVLNKGFTRQNAVIDEAISAERKKPKPDANAINNLNRFRLPIQDCGVNPADD